MFSPAFLNAAPQPVRAQAPVNCPAEVAALLSLPRMNAFHSQFTDEAAPVFDASAEITPEQVQQFLAVVRERMGRTVSVVNLASAPSILLHNSAWIMFDTRRCPDPPSRDPITAGLPSISSMAIFQLHAMPVDSRLPVMGDNVYWVATLVANKIVASEGLPLVDIPPKMVLSIQKIKRGYSPFSSFRAAFDGVVWPPDITFMERGLDGNPVSPVTLAGVNTVGQPAIRLGNSLPVGQGLPLGILPSDEDRIARESKVKQATKDHQAISRFRGLYEHDSFTALFGDDAFPTLTGAKESVCEIVSHTVNELSLTEAQAEKFINSKFGSNLGVTAIDRISILLFAQKNTSPTVHVLDFTIMFNRFRDCASAVFGNCARMALDALFSMLSESLYPVAGGDPNSALIGPAFAIDIVNDALYQVGHNVNLRELFSLERWMPPMVNIRTTPVFQNAIFLQNITRIETIAETCASAAIKRKGVPTGGTGRSTGKQKKPKGTPGSKKSDQPPTGVTTPAASSVRCRQQDRPEGCAFGLRCRFQHDAAHPKTDTAGTAARS